ncbi:MAG: hypothetical protein Q8R02_01895 [Hyphomonadaceae bacterium]|nr:hypothetical protein [Hyphomonadaceae bacterium]
MGLAISWCGVQGSRADVLDAAHLQDTNEADEYYETAFAAADFPGGWTVIVAKDFSHFLDEGRLKEFSKGRRLVAVLVEEHAMFCKASEWRDGAEIWSAEHDGDTGPAMQTSGALPASFADVHAEMLAKQESDKEVDFIFEVPVVLAQQIVGFKHDEELPGGSKFMKVLPITSDRGKGGGLFGLFRK